MPKILQFQVKDKQGKLRNAGRMEIKNQTDDTAELYFYGDICSEAWQSAWYPDDQAPSDVQEFLKNLDGVTTLHVHINSGGGSVTGGIAIGNMLKAHPAKTIAYIDAMAASIATVIALSCDEVVIYKNSIFMIHKPMSSVWGGNADDMRKEAEILDTCQQCILTTYMEKVREGVTEEQINEFINAETWWTGEVAAEYFDMQVADGLEDAAAATSQYFDKYSNLPEDLKKEKPKTVTVEDFRKMLNNCDMPASEKNKIDVIIGMLIDGETTETNDGTPEDIERENLKNEILKDLDYI